MKNLAILGLLSVTAASCVAEMGDEADYLANEAQEVATSNAMTANRISANRITANRITANRITANAILADLSSAPELANNESSREFLKYFVECAVPAGQTVYFRDHQDNVFEVAGAIGAAPEWMDGPMSEDGKERVTACLLARTNFFGISIPISIRANAAGMVADEAENAAFPFYEATFFGNVFKDPPEMYSCQGLGVYYSTVYGLVGSQYLSNRVCAQGDQCGFVAQGPCGRYGQWIDLSWIGGGSFEYAPPWSCRNDAGLNGAGECHAEAAFADYDEQASTRAWNNPVSVFLPQ